MSYMYKNPNMNYQNTRSLRLSEDFLFYFYLSYLMIVFLDFE